jgi:hypothetical protein
MSSSLANYASRVMSVGQESSSFVPIVGLNRAPDMPILDAMMLAWHDCAQLHAAIDEDDIEVPLRLMSPLAPPLTHTAGYRHRRSHALHEPFRGGPSRLER